MGEAAMDLKTWPAFFNGLWDGSKTYELRFDERAYEVGQILRLREWLPRHRSGLLNTDVPGMYSGRFVTVRVTRVDRLSDVPMIQQNTSGTSAYLLISFEFLSRGLDDVFAMPHNAARCVCGARGEQLVQYRPTCQVLDIPALECFIKQTRDSLVEVVESRLDAVAARLK